MYKLYQITDVSKAAAMKKKNKLNFLILVILKL
jgi:hypothetical protein